MTKELIIVFVKNIKLGKVKTRLAKTIGNQAAFEVYSELVKITERALENLPQDKRIYFSDAIIETKWTDCDKAVQYGEDLGQRMKNAFQKGLEDGYDRIVLIGSDLPDIHATHITNGLQALSANNIIFGPAIDGGYYLIGMTKMFEFVFENKPWSQSNLLTETLAELNQNAITYSLLESLNDIDTVEDLEASEFYKTNKKLQQRIEQLND